MRKLLDFSNRVILFPLYTLAIVLLWLCYLATGSLSEIGYRLYRKLYFISGGISNMVLELLFAIKSSDYKTYEAKSISDWGYFLIPNFMSAEETERLSQYVLDNADTKKSSTRMDVPEGRLYGVDILDKVFFKNEYIKDIAEDYLGTNCILDLRAAWRSFPNEQNNSENLSLAAQMWHADLDTVKWLKAFVYLTDVDVNNGPHCFCPSTHKTLPLGIIRDGRYSDDMISKLNIESRILTGSKGTLILADTRALHKGLEVLDGERRIIQLQYSANSFGKLNRL